MGTLILLAVAGWVIYIVFLAPEPKSREAVTRLAIPTKTPIPSLWPGLETKCHLAGAPYYFGGKDAYYFKIFSIGQTLTAIREPSNPYDCMAILLTLCGDKVGHVPRANNRHHALHMDAGGGIHVVVSAVNPEDPWTGVSITVKNL